ncbi:MAG: D-alanyl-D-alanine carboxypeptidase/D-alanyl-D-alanine-endopeptidase [Bacteroidales bacterium]|jgi:D-alanyl-D-alanine carboxypeptidase/D-alanyl-D-alanine-endopeptidase (penicillin-binding protein 4)
MKITFIIISLACITFRSFSQEISSETFLADSSLAHASVSLCVADSKTGEIILDYNSGISLMPASVMKVITSAAALELLGPAYSFKTTVGYTGSLNKRWGRLKGNIIILGGGDPALGSEYFSDHYNNFLSNWVAEIKKLGIKKIKGRVITDDSYFDFLPVPSKWLWEDEGNYYGAGSYGLSVFDNMYEIHFRTTADSSSPAIERIIPDECKPELSSYLIASGTTDEGYVFAAPYSTKGWLAGKIPVNQIDFVLKASITDPPLLLAKIVNEKLKASGIKISADPTTVRLGNSYKPAKVIQITETISPPLTDIIHVLNHESVNLYAEHLIKELGKRFKNNGSTASGAEVITEFLKNSGIDTNGMFIEDGSGLSPLNAINTRELVRLLVYMKNKGKYFSDYYSSLPDAGKNGTLKNYFKDPVFDSRLKAKSGSMTRVRSFAGYFTTVSGKEMAFSIIINNYSGSSKKIISEIEENIKELISNN